MNDDPAHIITIPLQSKITVSETHHGQALVIPPNIWRALDVWMCIKDPEIRGKVGKVIQKRLDDLRVSPS
jgi:hypothetical protein